MDRIPEHGPGQDVPPGPRQDLLERVTLNTKIQPGPVIPYGRQWIDDEDIEAVVSVLKSDWLTTGPKVDEFETAFARAVSAGRAVAVNSGTAALHAAMYALGIGPGDEVIVPPMTFAATANAVLYQGGTPVFADVEPDTLLIDPAAVERKITPKTRAVIAVDYAGQPCRYVELRAIASQHGLALVADACHSVGGTLNGRPVGTLADLSVFSFHPVKHMTTGEGGMITTDDEGYAARLKLFRNHGITSDHRERAGNGQWFYEMVDLGFNYRITDIQCALGLSQLRKLPAFLARRREIAGIYDRAFAKMRPVEPLAVHPGAEHAYHLYVVRMDFEGLGRSRTEFLQFMHGLGIRVNVHYVPVHLHPFYRTRLGTAAGDCPVAEDAYERIVTLPLYPAMEESAVERVLEAVRAFCEDKEA